MDDVKDVDQGWGALVKRVALADGLEARMGYLSGVPKYPRERGKTAVAKVAGVHGVHRLISQIWDQAESERAKALEKVVDKIKRGADPEGALLEFAEMIRDKFRAGVRGADLVDTGRLVEGLRATVFDGRKVVAGDDPKQPRMGNRGPF